MGHYSLFITYLIVFFGTVNLLRIVFFMVGSDIYSVQKALREKKRGRLFFLPKPSFSVIIPAHNEESTILPAIMSVIMADYAHDKLQLIVVDDGSTDKTYTLVEKYRRRYNLNFFLIRQKNSGKASALNNAIKNYAVGELVMCLDADSTIAPDALAKAAVYFENPRVVALSANVKIRPTGTLFNLIQRFEYLVCYQMKRAQTVFNIEYIIGGIGSTFRRTALEEVGFYDTDTMTEDIDLTMKFLQLGNRERGVIYGADVITYTESVLDLPGLIRQRFRWKYGRCQTFIKNASLFFSRDKRHGKKLSWFYLPYALFGDLAFFFEPFLVGYLLYLVFRFGDVASILSAFVVISIYIIMNILAEDTLPIKEKLKHLPLAPAMYLLFYVLSYAEYMALIKTYGKFWQVPQSLKKRECGWEHVARVKSLIA